MSYIPNCRTDEWYNDKYLNEDDKRIVHGYDWAVMQIVSLIRYNTDVFAELDMILDKDIAVVNRNKKKIVRKAIEEWAEMERNELITSMIDSMGQDALKANKERVDAEEAGKAEAEAK